MTSSRFQAPPPNWLLGQMLVTGPPSIGHPLEQTAGVEPDVAAVGRPEGQRRALGADDGIQVARAHRAPVEQLRAVGPRREDHDAAVRRHAGVVRRRVEAERLLHHHVELDGHHRRPGRRAAEPAAPGQDGRGEQQGEHRRTEPERRQQRSPVAAAGQRQPRPGRRAGAEDRPERVLQLADGVIAGVARRGDGALDDAHQRFRQIGSRVEQADALMLPMRRFEIAQRLALDRVPAGEQEEQQHTDRVDVAGRRGAFPGQQLGRQVERRALQRRRVGVVDAVRPAEVHQHDAPADFAHHVGRLDVAVDQAMRVQRRHGTADVDADAGRLASAHRAAGGDGVGQRLAVDQLHPQAGLARVVLDAVDGDDVGVTHPGQGAGLAQRRGGPVGERVQELDRDFAIELRVPGAVDVAGEARGERLEDQQRAPRPDRRPRALARPGRPGRALAAAAAHDLAQAVQLLDDRRLVMRRAGARRRPVDGLAGRHGGRQRYQPGFVRRRVSHAAST